MVRTRSYYHPQFIMLDEVFDALDRYIIDGLVSLLPGMEELLLDLFL